MNTETEQFLPEIRSGLLSSMHRKMSLKIAFVVTLLCLLQVQSTNAIKCYKCNSIVTPDCKDPFSDDGVPKVEAEHCSKTKVTVSGVQGVTRHEWSDSLFIADGCSSEGDGTICICSTDLCNGAIMSAKPLLAILGMATVIAWFFS